MESQVLKYEVDGLQMESHLYYDKNASGSRPGVLVFPEAMGLGDHAKGKAQRLAKAGYVALACDLHGKGTVMTDMAAMMASPPRRVAANAMIVALRAGGVATGRMRRPGKVIVVMASRQKTLERARSLQDRLSHPGGTPDVSP